MSWFKDRSPACHRSSRRSSAAKRRWLRLRSLVALWSLVLAFWGGSGTGLSWASPLPTWKSVPSSLLGASGQSGFGPGGNGGKGHLVSGTADQARSGGTGKPAGTAPGQLSAYQRKSGQPKAGNTGRSPLNVQGFDAKTSKLDQAKSSATQDVYDNADGTTTAHVFQAPVNYRQGNGDWAPIVTSLKPDAGSSSPQASSPQQGSAKAGSATTGSTTTGPARLTESSAGTQAATFAGSGADPNLLTYSFAAGESVSFGLVGAAPVAPTVSGSVATYTDVLPGVNLKLEAFGSGAKESIVLDSAAAPRSFSYTMSLTGLTARLESDGSIGFHDKSGAEVGEVPPGVMADANVAPGSQLSPTSHGVTYALSGGAAAPTLTIGLDRAWLDAPARVYPVTVDPTVYTNPPINASSSTYALNLGTNNEASDVVLDVGECGSTSLCGQIVKADAFLSFPSIGSTVGKNDVIDSAQLVMDEVWAEQCSNSGIFTSSESAFAAAPVTQSWTATAMITYPAWNRGAQSGSLTPPVSNNACNGTGQWVTMNLSPSTFNSWTSGNSSNYGLSVYAAESDMTWKKFASVNTPNPPYVSFTYQADTAPNINGMLPASQAQLQTLTPELTVSAVDPDNYPGKGLQYEFEVYNYSGANPTLVADSGTLSSGEWAVPSGDLVWNGEYYWQARVGDTIGWSPYSSPDYFNLTVQQPPVTSLLGGTNPFPGYNSLTGDYTAQATDATLSTPGPKLSLVRTYNSADPRTEQAFGAGWSTVVDASAALTGDGNTNLDVTYPDGQQTRFGRNANGTFVSPEGQSQTVTAATTTPPAGSYCPAVSTGFCVLDSTGSTYAFTVPANSLAGTSTNGPWLLSSVTDNQGRAIDFTYTAVNIAPLGDRQGETAEKVASMTACVAACQGSSPVTAQSLQFSWVSARTGVLLTSNFTHVTQVVANSTSGATGASGQVWTYTYKGDQLTAVCDPAEQAGGCATQLAYGYASGSQFSSGVQDTSPSNYWRLGDAAASANAADSVLANEGADNATASNVTFGVSSAAAGPAGLLTGATTGGPLDTGETVASFNGTSSWLQLPSNLVVNKEYLSIGLWFRTSSPGILFDEEDGAVGGAAPAHSTASLYVGTDGKLHGAFYAGGTTAAYQAISSTTVTDNAWHYAVLSAAGNTQTLYLDGSIACTSGCTISGTLNDAGQFDDYVGAGYSSGSWPSQPATGWNYFHGEIAEVSYYSQQLGADAVGELYDAAQDPSAMLESITDPAGTGSATVQYDVAADRVTSVTDADGGSYTVGAPTVSGSSAVYVGSVLGAGPQGYWRLNDSAQSGQSANNTVTAHTGTPGSITCLPRENICIRHLASVSDPSGDGTYNNVTLGAAGSSPFADSTGGQFDGSTSYLQLPSDITPAGGPQAIGLWFKTSTPTGMLLSGQGASLASTTGGALPELYVGSDGLLHGNSWHAAGVGSMQLASTATVDDGKWHYAVLSTNGVFEYLYLDGTLVAHATTTAEQTAGGYEYNYIGAGSTADGWNALPNYANVYFNGDIADVAVYNHDISADTVAGQYAELKTANGSATPVLSESVVDPEGDTLTDSFDPLNGGRILTSADAQGGTTRYGYDSGGFLYTVTDPLGNVTTTGHDVRGNTIATTTCQNQAAEQCSTSYATYWPDDSTSTLTPDPRDNLKTSMRDGRSASSADPTYMTQYAYNAQGKLLTTVDPLGRTTTNTYSVGTEAAVTAPTSTSAAASCPAASLTSGTIPAGLLLKTVKPGGGTTTYQYYANGELAVQTTALGDKTVYVYNPAGQILFQTECDTTYPNGVVTAYTYDAQGRPLTTTEPATADAVTGLTHQQQTTNNYNNLGQVQSTTVADIGASTAPDPSRTTQYTYWPSGLQKTVTDPTGAVTSYTFNDDGEKIGETEPNGDTYQYDYDNAGNQTETILTNYTGTVQGACQPTAGQLITENDTYDLDGRLASSTDAMCRVNDVTYYDNGLQASVTKVSPSSTQGPNVVENKTYDAAGNLVGDSTGNGLSDTLNTYDADSDVTLTRALYSTSSTGTPLYKNTQSVFNPAGQVASVSRWQDDGSGTVRTTSYTYDKAGNRLTSSVAQSSLSQQQAAAALDGQWNLADGATTTAADGSGANHPAALAGGAGWSDTAPGGLGGSLHTDGSTGYAAASGGPLTTSGSFTISAWVYLTDDSGTDTAVAQAASKASAFYLQEYGGKWAFSMVNTDTAAPSASYRATSNSAVALNTWTHLTGAYTKSTGLLQLWVNGQIQTTTATDTTPFASTGSLLIGRSQYNSAAADWWHGQIADVQAYNTALTGDQVVQVYNNQAPPSQALVGSWLLADGSAPAAADSAAGGHPAAAAGGLQWNSSQNGAVALDGTSGYLATSGPVVNTAGSFSVGAWVNATSDTGNHSIVAQAGSVDSGFYLQDMGTSGWTFTMQSSDSTTSTAYRAQTGTAPALNTWTYLTAVYNAQTHAMQLYVNGVLSGTATNTAPWNAAGALMIGRSESSGGYGDYFAGSIHGVSVWGTALTGNQVSQLYAGTPLVATAAQAVTSDTYDQRGDRLTTTTPLGNVSGAASGSYTTSYAADQRGRVTETVLPPIITTVNGVASAGPVAPITLTGYDTFGDALETQDADGNISTSTYDGDGRVLKASQPSYTQAGSTGYTATFIPTTQTFYNPDGTVDHVIDAAGNTTSYAYDQLGDQITETDPQTTVTTAAGVTSTTSPVTAQTYDQDREVTSTTTPDQAGTGSVSASYQYNYLGQQTSQSNALGGTTTLGFDVLGHMTSLQNPNQNAATYTYDNAGEQTSSTDTSGNKTQYAYDVAGDKVTVTNPDQSSTVNTYDLNGAEVASADYSPTGQMQRSDSTAYDLNGEVVSRTDYLGNQETFAYDQDGEQIGQTEPTTSSHSVSTSLGYDAAGHQTAYTSGNGNLTYWTYNSLGLKQSKVVPASSGFPGLPDRTTTAVYDQNGNQVEQLEPGSVTLTRQYNPAGALTAEQGTISGAPTATDSLTYGYDPSGNLTTAATVNAAGASDTSDGFGYDAAGDLTTTTGTSGAATLNYNNGQQMTSRQDGAGTTSYQYNTAGQVAQVTDGLTGTAATYLYNTMDQIKSITYGTGGASQQFGYDPMHRLTSDKLENSGGSQVAAIDYGYDLNDNEINQTTWGLGTTSSSTDVVNNYTYDEANRLTSWANGTSSTYYGYDDDGNRTCVTQNTAGCTVANTTHGFNALDQLTSDGTDSYTYTANGTLAAVSPIAGGTAQNYTYNAYQQQTSDGTSTDTYDALGRMTSATSTSGTVTLLYSGTGNQEVSDGSRVYALDPAGTIVADRTPSGSTHLTWTDQHDNLVAEFSPAANGLASWQTLDPLGNQVSKSYWSASAGYQSGYTANGKVEMGARWYSPGTGQFDSADTQANSPNPVSVNANPYAYANDAPLTGMDPSGHSCDTSGLIPQASQCPPSNQGTPGYTAPGWGQGNPLNSIGCGDDPESAEDAACNGADLLLDLMIWLGGQTCADYVCGTPDPEPNAPPVPPGGGGGSGGGDPWNWFPFDFDICSLVPGICSSPTPGGPDAPPHAVRRPGPPPPPPCPEWECHKTPNKPNPCKGVKAALCVAAPLVPLLPVIGAPFAAPILIPPTLPVTDPGEPGDPDQCDNNTTLDALGAAPSPGPSCGNQNTPHNCLTQPWPAGANPNSYNGGWDLYGPVDATTNRSTDAEACAAKTNTGSANYRPPTVYPSGWTAGMARCHLVPSVLGGYGGRANLETCWPRTNTGAGSMRAFETIAQNDLNLPATAALEYHATPVYNSTSSTIARGFNLWFISWTFSNVMWGGSTYIANNANGAKPNIGN